ncbi:MAG TPA: cytosine permease [Solirubrobacteraceae bacterium]|nr:cytosine permease [Solirubrobacteraceae bacterium]
MAEDLAAVETPAEIEQRTIAQVPDSERKGRVRNLFTIWFASNIMLLTVVTGALATTVYGLSLGCAALGLVIGNLFGGVFMALHSAQGPKLGVPQMIQSRGQFGAYGALVVVAVVIIMYLGFIASNVVLGGQALNNLTSGISVDLGIVITSLVGLAICVFGHDMIHLVNRVLTPLCLAVLVLAVVALFVKGAPHGTLSRGTITFTGFVATIAVAVLWQIAYAPYVSDYSRYLPEKTPASQTFWASYWGCVLGSAGPMIFGALLGAASPAASTISEMHTSAGAVGWLVVLVIGFGMVNTISINIYGGVLGVVTSVQTFRASWVPRGSVRLALSVAITIVAAVMALAGKNNFVTNYTNFIFLLLYLLIPWTGINLVDFYLVKHGHYDVGSFFQDDGGIYGRFNLPACVVYVIGVAVEVPFIATTLYTGPVGSSLHGADISWLVGLAVVCPLYYWAAKRFLSRQQIDVDGHQAEVPVVEAGI